MKIKENCYGFQKPFVLFVLHCFLIEYCYLNICNILNMHYAPYTVYLIQYILSNFFARGMYYISDISQKLDYLSYGTLMKQI